MVAEDIIIKPIVTEKSTYAQAQGQKAEKKYTFKVNRKATKIDIKNAVQTLFGVKVTNVTTMNVKGTTRTRNGRTYKTATWKKAIVTVATEIPTMTYQGKGGKDVKAKKTFNTEIKEFGV